MAKVIEKRFWESKTFWVNVVGLIVVVLEYLGTINIPFLTPEMLTATLAILNIILRFITNQPIARTVR